MTLTTLLLTPESSNDRFISVWNMVNTIIAINATTTKKISIEGTKLYAAGCFLPLAQSEFLPKEMGSRHRAALGVTTVASVTAIVVSEETGIISIVKNGAVKKKYADATDIKEALSDYYIFYRGDDISVRHGRTAEFANFN